MDSKIKYMLDNELSGSGYEALNTAVKSIYFNDNSDYLSALYDIVAELLDGSAPDDMDDEFINELVHYLNPDWNEREINVEEARHMISDYITKCGYTYKVDDIIDGYENYYKQGHYVSFTMKDCIENMKQELMIICNTQ